MCIIIAKKAGVKRLDSEYFSRAWDRNPDGGGLVWKKPNEDVVVQKGFMKKEDFLKKIDEVNQDDTAFIAHFRIKSVGAVCAENTHPFVMDHVTYAHNGTLSIEPFAGKTDSETFGLCFLKDKKMDWIKEYKVLLEMALGTSKFAIMDNETGEILILNPECGKERDDAWFSNESAFPPAATTPAKWYSGYHDYNNYDDIYNSKFTVMANKTFGTKRYKEAGAFVDKGGCWCYNTTRRPLYCTGYSDNVKRHKRGFMIIDPNIPVPKDATDKKYESSSKEVKLVDAMTRQLYKSLADYHKTEFETAIDRTDAEHELSAMYTVIRAMYAFIRAKKTIDDKEFLSFCLDNTEPDTWVGKNSVHKAYYEYVSLYAEDVLEELGKGKAKA